MEAEVDPLHRRGAGCQRELEVEHLLQARESRGIEGRVADGCCAE